MTLERLLFSAVLLALACNAAADDGPLVIAHRGASGYLPEHTLEAAAMAHAQGADFIEQDVVLTKDGIPVVLHDLSLEAVTDAAERFPGRARVDGCRYAIDFTLDELRLLRVHERRDHKTGRQRYPGRFPADTGDFRIATLAEHLALVAGLERSTGRRMRVYTEIKHPAWHRNEGQDVTTATLEVLRAHGHDGAGCRLQTFDRDEVRRLRHDLKWPGGLTLLVGEASRDAAGGRDPLLEPGALDAIAADADGLGPPMARVVGPDGTPTGLAAAAHAAGLMVHAYTLRCDDLPPFADSTEAALDALCDDAAIDGVFTDFPDVAVAWRRDRR
jgi:glycerophosphoryl diester phosphodiesterase